MTPAEARNAALKALMRIEAWEMPSTGKTFSDGTPMSWGIAFGSNGERDVIREIAREAIRALISSAPAPVEGVDPFPIFADRLRIRREEFDEAEVNFESDDILALAMDVLSETGWKSPDEVLPAPQAGNAVEDEVVELLQECEAALCRHIPEAHGVHPNPEFEVVDKVRAALEAMKG